MTGMVIPDIAAIIARKAEEYTPKILKTVGREGYKAVYIEAFAQEILYYLETRHVSSIEDLSSENWRAIKMLGHDAAMRRIEALAQENRERAARKLQVGDSITLEVNQGERNAVVLAVIGNEALVEYSMPKGSTALRVVDIYTWAGNRTISYRNVPKKWLKEMYEQEIEWEGYPQGTIKMKYGTRYLVNSPLSVKATYEQKYGSAR